MAALGLAFLCLAAVFIIIGLFRLMGDPNVRIDYGALFISVITFVIGAGLSGIQLFAGIQMVRLQNYAVAMAGCVLMMISGFCGMLPALGIASMGAKAPGAGVQAALMIIVPLILTIIGLGGMVVLIREDIRRAFS